MCLVFFQSQSFTVLYFLFHIYFFFSPPLRCIFPRASPLCYRGMHDAHAVTIFGLFWELFMYDNQEVIDHG